MTFEKEQIVVWRGKDYKPPADGQFPLGDWESCSYTKTEEVCSSKESDYPANSRSNKEFCSSDED